MCALLRAPSKFQPRVLDMYESGPAKITNNQRCRHKNSYFRSFWAKPWNPCRSIGIASNFNINFGNIMRIQSAICRFNGVRRSLK
jgi:hypothetical protein